MRDVAQFFKVLADEARLQILWLLFNNSELCVCDIVEALGITQSKASRHLATLRHAGLVLDRREGAWMYYSLRAPGSELERGQLELLRGQLANHVEAGQLLSSLEGWFARKHQETACAPPRTRVSAARGRTAKSGPGAEGGCPDPGTTIHLLGPSDNRG